MCGTAYVEFQPKMTLVQSLQLLAAFPFSVLERRFGYFHLPIGDGGWWYLIPFAMTVAFIAIVLLFAFFVWRRRGRK
jgi:hypothetical protein